MSNKSFSLSEPLYRYLCEVSLREPALLRQLREDTAQREDANMQIAPEQGQFMAMLLRLMQAHQVIEVGVYTGYSSLIMAQALPRDGRILACDINPETTEIARQAWARAGVVDKIDLQLAPALETLDKEIAAGHAGRYDFAFIDADKTNYANYYERCLALLRPGGLIVVDNTLWAGRVLDTESDDEDTRAIQAFNQQVADDTRVDISLLPLADGLTLLHKR